MNRCWWDAAAAAVSSDVSTPPFGARIRIRSGRKRGGAPASPAALTPIPLAVSLISPGGVLTEQRRAELQVEVRGFAAAAAVALAASSDLPLHIPVLRLHGLHVRIRTHTTHTHKPRTNHAAALACTYHSTLLQLERDRVFQKQLQEIQSVIARYRGPLLESGALGARILGPGIAGFSRASEAQHQHAPLPPLASPCACVVAHSHACPPSLHTHTVSNANATNSHRPGAAPVAPGDRPVL